MVMAGNMEMMMTDTPTLSAMMAQPFWQVFCTYPTLIDAKFSIKGDVLFVWDDACTEMAEAMRDDDGTEAVVWEYRNGIPRDVTADAKDTLATWCVNRGDDLPVWLGGEEPEAEWNPTEYDYRDEVKA